MRLANRIVTGALLTLLLAVPAAAQADRTKEALAQEERLSEAVERVLPAYAFIGGGGSGVLVTADGYILTNDHVAGSAWVWRVRTMDGVLRYADLVGTDPYGDIALLLLRDVEDMPHLPLGDANQLEVGQAVIALGNPFGMGNVDEKPTVTVGIVSTLHRFQNNYTDAIMTDAPLNPGNSGGPLVTLEGKLVGINGQIATRFGVRANTGVGYAITVNQIKNFLQDLMAADGGYVRHGTIPGLELPAPEDNVRPPRVVRSGAAAAKAGFRPGDEIVEVEGRPVTTVTRFHGIVGTYPEGSELQVHVRREGEIVPLQVRLVPMDLPGEPTLRATISGEAFHGGGAGPLHVVKAVEGSPAAKAGVKAGDRLVSIAGIDLSEALRMSPHADLLDQIVAARAAQGGVLIELTVLREGKKEQLFLDIEKGEKKLGVELGQVNGGGGEDTSPRAVQDRELAILEVVEGCGLWRAGVRAGDVLVGFAGQDLATYADLVHKLAKLKPGTRVEVAFRRDGRVQRAKTVVDLQRAGPG